MYFLIIKGLGFDGFVCFPNRFYNRFYAVLCGFLAFGPTVFWSSTPAGGGFGLPVFWSSTMVCTHKNWNSPHQALSAEVGGQRQLGVALASLFFGGQQWAAPGKLELPPPGHCQLKLGVKAIPGSLFGREHHIVLAAR